MSAVSDSDEAPAARILECAAPATSCGTASGWRVGGRCFNCRRAHNADIAGHRGYGLTAEQRSAAIATARDGRDVSEVADAAGCAIRTLVNATTTDSELDAVLSGRDSSAQYLARYGDYLTALIRHDGSVRDAAESIGMNPGSVYRARYSDPGFAAAEEAIRSWITSATTQLRGRITGPMLDRAAEVVRQTGSLGDAAEAIGVNNNALRYWVKRDPEGALARAWAEVPRRGRRRELTEAEAATVLEGLEASLSINRLAAAIGIAYRTLRARIDESPQLREAYERARAA